MGGVSVCLRNVYISGVAAIAALPLVALSSAIRAETPVIPLPTPYQATQTDAFRYPVSLDGHPTVYLSSYSLHDAPTAARLAQLDKKQCNGEAYARDIGQLREDQKFEDHYYHEKLKAIAEAKAQLESDQAVYDAYKEAFNEAVAAGKDTKAPYARMAKAEEALKRDEYNSGPYAEADAERMLQDANTIGTLILWLEEMKFNCHEVVKRRGLPPPLQAPPPTPAPPPAHDVPPQVRDAPRCARTEAVILQINEARTNPTGYLRRWHSPPLDVETFLKQQAPLPPIKEIRPLDDAAQRHADDQGPIGLQGHVGTDGSKPMQRIHDAGLYAMLNEEVISVGETTAEGEIHQLITDPGNVGHPHRDDLFNPQVTLAGVGCAPDKKYGQITVIDLSSPSVR